MPSSAARFRRAFHASTLALAEDPAAPVAAIPGRSCPDHRKHCDGRARYEAETRAFVNEANFWQMVVGPLGKTTADPIETQENAKMFAFVGNSHFADLVVRTTASYVKQCGVDRAQ